MNLLTKISTTAMACIWTLVADAQSETWEPASKQEIANAYQQACNWFINTPNYYFKLKYVSYRNHISKDQIESSEGYYKRVAGSYVTEAVGLKTSQNATIKVVVDTADRVITVMSPGNLSPNLASTEELEALLGNAKTLKKFKEINGTKYKINFNKNDKYEAFEFSINNKGIIDGLIYYYSEQIEKVNNGEGSEYNKEIRMKPRLEITFYGFQIPTKYDDAEFSDRNVTVKDKGKIDLMGAYKDYRLLDYRLQTKK